MKFSADLWPDLDIGQRSENVQIVISPSIFGEILPDWYQRISLPSLIELCMGYAIWPIFARSHDLKLVCQVTLNWETRISPVSLYIQTGFGPPGLESRFHITEIETNSPLITPGDKFRPSYSSDQARPTSTTHTYSSSPILNPTASVAYGLARGIGDLTFASSNQLHAPVFFNQDISF